MSGNGRFFAYFSFDGNIVADDTVMCGEGEYAISCEDLFIYDRETGTTEMVALGRGEGLGADYTLSLTPDGRYIALGHERNLLFYDRETKETQFLLTTIEGTEPTSAVYVPAISADGRYITFVSYANNLVADDTNEDADVFVLDRQTDQIERVSVASNGTQGNGTSGAMLGHESITISADMSADGRFVTFATTADNLGGEPFQDCVNYLSEPRPCYNVYVHDRDTGETRLISQDLDSDSLSAVISGDGRYIAFNSRTTTLGAVMSPLCNPACNNIYLYDQTTGETLLMGEAPNGDGWVRDISADGRYIAFVSYASNLVPNDNNGDMDVFRYDRETNQIEAISIPGG
jgi:Tol biopolymer transport system component